MRIDALEEIIARGQVGAVVATVGTTATGAVDPLDRLVELRGRHGFRLHADAAYGGYFRLVHGLAPATRAALDALADVDSAVVDPHKHGLQPYGCGCILFRDPSVGAHYRHDSPYTYFTSAELHLGEISLECSRPGAAAVALWATQRLLPLRPEGTFARDLARCHQAALALHARLRSDPRFITGAPPELDLVTWLPTGVSLSEMSQRARAIFDAAARRGLHLALADLPPALFADAARAKLDRPPAPDRERVTALRSCLMKPEHVEWIDRIWTILDASAGGQ
jgi:glutamate/tyrosine decarboxylase-like PLP-dependent enzyme